MAWDAEHSRDSAKPPVTVSCPPSAVTLQLYHRTSLTTERCKKIDPPSNLDLILSRCRSP